MPATKFTHIKPLLRTLTGYAVRTVLVSLAAAALGAGVAVATVAAAPKATARIAGHWFCPIGASAAIGFPEKLKAKDWTGRVWALPTPELQCAGEHGLPLAADRAFNTVWYGTFAAGAAAMAGLVYGMWGLTSTLAGGRPRLPTEPAGPDFPALFLEECCELNPKKRAPAAQLNAAFAAWSQAKGHKLPARKTLPRHWKRLGLRPRGLFSAHTYRGVRLKEQF